MICLNLNMLCINLCVRRPRPRCDCREWLHWRTSNRMGDSLQHCPVTLILLSNAAEQPDFNRIIHVLGYLRLKSD